MRRGDLSEEGKNCTDVENTRRKKTRKNGPKNHGIKIRKEDGKTRSKIEGKEKIHGKNERKRSKIKKTNKKSSTEKMQ